MLKEDTLQRFIYLLILGAVIFVITSACTQEINQHTASSVELSSEECRVIQHAMGEICIPTQPQRIITLDIFSLGNSLTLGIEPLAGGSLRQHGDLPDYLEKNAKNLENIGLECQPDIEKILLLKPDLIFGRTSCSQIYSLLSKIAPTVLSKWYIGTHWRENFDFTADVLRKEISAKEAWNQYFNRIEKLRYILAEKYQGKKISVIEFHLSRISAFTNNSFPGSILSDLGLQRPDAQDVDAEYGYIEVSEEELEKIDGDILFIMIANNDDEKLLESFKRKSLWEKLRVAQANQIYVVKNNIWWGGNLLAANLMLDDLEKYLIKANSQ
jgi:iron complex transport system substrate-binding protein